MLRLTGTVLCVLAFGLACHRANNPVSPENSRSKLAWLRVEGARIVDESGETVTLHGVNRSGLEYDRLRGKDISRQEIDYICRKWRANVIRIPFNQEWVLTDRTYVEKLDQVIQWVKDNGAYVILDLQWRDTATKIPSMPDANAVRMWRQLVERYRDEPAVLYDIHNEAHDVDFASWRKRAIEIIEAIREVHPNTLHVDSR